MMNSRAAQANRAWLLILTATVVIVFGPANARGSEAFKYPALSKGITSFGAAVVGDWLYVYGGHFGRAHHYSNKSQSNELSRLNLKHNGKWDVVAEGPRLQGLAMVAHDDKLYRVGGFMAHNEEGDEHDLHSVADFVQFDPATSNWKELSPMPAPRSSHDAVVIGDKLYVAGGWSLGEDSQWHDTAYVVDLSTEPLKWRALPAAPFKRRALSLGTYDGKLFVIGGMQEKGGPTTRVAVFDPSTQIWSEGPKLNGEGMAGFGSSACNAAGKLFVSTYDGKLQRLADDGSKWLVAGTLEDDRFFHRMVPYAESLILVGGASMEEGKRIQMEVVDLSRLE